MTNHAFSLKYPTPQSQTIEKRPPLASMGFALHFAVAMWTWAPQAQQISVCHGRTWIQFVSPVVLRGLLRSIA